MHPLFSRRRSVIRRRTGFAPGFANVVQPRKAKASSAELTLFCSNDPENDGIDSTLKLVAKQYFAGQVSSHEINRVKVMACRDLPEEDSVHTECCRKLRADLRPRLGHQSSLALSGVANGKVRAVGVLEGQRTHAGFRVHHEAFGQLHADLFGAQQLP